MNIKEIFQNWVDKKKEKAAFRAEVEKHTLPIRRQAYFEARKKQAQEEGAMIANKEFQKQKQANQANQSNDPFGLQNPLKFINKQEDNKNGK